MTVSRRSALAWLVATSGAAALTACAGPPSPTTALSSATPPGPTPVRPRPTPSASTTPLAAEVVPDLAAIEARFRDATPEEWGLHVTGVVNRAPEGATGITLTLDGCGGSGGDRADLSLIDGLRAREIPATLFLNLRWIETNRVLAEELVAVPFFELANHGCAHRPLSVNGRSAYGIEGTSSVAEVIDEVWSNHVALTQLTGRAPRWFRSGTAHYDEVAVQIVQELGETVVGFDVNGDAGATFDAASVEDALLSAVPGSIIIAHLNQPSSGTAGGIERAVDRMLERGDVFGFPDGATTPP